MSEVSKINLRTKDNPEGELYDIRDDVARESLDEIIDAKYLSTTDDMELSEEEKKQARKNINASKIYNGFCTVSVTSSEATAVVQDSSSQYELDLSLDDYVVICSCSNTDMVTYGITCVDASKDATSGKSTLTFSIAVPSSTSGTTATINVMILEKD